MSGRPPDRGAQASRSAKLERVDDPASIRAISDASKSLPVLTDRDKQIVHKTWRLVVPIAETAADLFYQRLFTLEPRYQQLFKGDFESQKRKLVRMLAFVVQSLDWRVADWREEVDEQSDLFLVVLALGRRHRELYAVPDAAYRTVGEALLWTLDYGLGEAFTPEAREAWTRVLSVISGTMMLGQFATDAGTPLGGKSWEELAS